jgi:hypothetical protein
LILDSILFRCDLSCVHSVLHGGNSSSNTTDPAELFVATLFGASRPLSRGRQTLWRLLSQNFDIIEDDLTTTSGSGDHVALNTKQRRGVK